MDPRLKEIVENFDDMKIGIDEPFQFGCKQCGKCCINREDILLNAMDVYRLCKELQMKPQQMIEEYGEAYIGGASRIPIVRLRPRGSIKRCRFMKDHKCSVHRAKPTVCAMFPIGRCIMFDKKKGEKPDYLNAEIQYIFNNPGCGSKSETHTVREWLADFRIPLDDPFFKKWNHVLAELGQIIRRAEEKFPDSTVEMMWNVIYGFLYLNYDIEQEFVPQFEKNAEEALSLLRLAPTGKGGK